MNLVEKLGGYELVKAKYQQLSESDVITIGPFEIEAKPYFEYELLEYRRANNIFEEGDKVVFEGITPHRKMIWQVTNFNNQVCVAPISNINGRLVIEGAFSVHPPYKIRHATDIEIAQGYRS